MRPSVWLLALILPMSAQAVGVSRVISETCVGDCLGSEIKDPVKEQVSGDHSLNGQAAPVSSEIEDRENQKKSGDETTRETIETKPGATSTPDLERELELEIALERELEAGPLGKKQLPGDVPSERANVLDRFGGDLQLFVSRLIAGIRDGTGRISFDDFKKEIAPVFYNAPAVVRLERLQSTLQTQVAEAEAAGEFQATFSAEQGQRGGSVDGSTSSSSVSASRMLFDGGAVEQAVKRAKISIQKTEADIQHARSQALLDLLLARLEVVAALQNRTLAREFLGLRNRFLDLVIQKKELGASSQADVIRAEAKTLEASADLPEAFQRVSEASHRYEELFGRPPPESIENYHLDGQNQFVAGNQLDTHPVIVAAQQDYEDAVAALSQLASDDLGSVSIVMSASRADTPSTSRSTQTEGKLVYSFNIFDGGAKDAQLERASGRIVETRLELERVRKEQARIVNTSKAGMVASQSLLASNLSLVVAAERARQATQELFVYNRGQISDVFEAQEDYIRAVQTLLATELQEKTAYFQYLHEVDELLALFEVTI